MSRFSELFKVAFLLYRKLFYSIGFISVQEGWLPNRLVAAGLLLYLNHGAPVDMSRWSGEALKPTKSMGINKCLVILHRCHTRLFPALSQARICPPLLLPWALLVLRRYIILEICKNTWINVIICKALKPLLSQLVSPLLSMRMLINIYLNFVVIFWRIYYYSTL